MTVKECPVCNKTFDASFADKCPECEAEFEEARLRKKKELLDERYNVVITEMQLRKEFFHTCDYCNEQFINLDECITHEKVCPKRPASKSY